jgi:nicotinamide-nucleotide amidase
MQDLVKKLSGLLLEKNMMITTAESCTGGLLSAAITDMPGSSRVFDRGFITYTNQSKTDFLNVPPDLISTHGAVSEQCAAAMAEGALNNTSAGIAISITGIAGPDGGTADKPVGLVYFGCAQKIYPTKTLKKTFNGNRQEIRAQAVNSALEFLITTLEQP